MILVLRNLVSNALKFTPDRGSITLHASYKMHSIPGTTSTVTTTKSVSPSTVSFQLRGKATVFTFPHRGTFTLVVEDTGVGMSAEQLPRLFHDGVQFNASALQTGRGSGLGLCISKGIVEQHGGTLTAHSEGLGKGTQFRLELPVYETPAPVQSQRDDDVSSYTSSQPSAYLAPEMHILVVDDVYSNRILLGRLLQNRGHTFVEADDGDVALEKITEALEEGRPFDTVLLDYEMPRLSGPAMVKKLRMQGNHTFVVGVTGNLLKEDVDLYLEAGADAVLGKPFKLTELEVLWAENHISPHNVK